jgi:two-component system phosphate regulon sensor histidine kinase PhoR
MKLLFVLLAMLLLLLVGGAALLVMQRRRARRFLRWIADPGASAPPTLPGIWGLVTAYSRRALTRTEMRVNENIARFDALLAAIDVLPAGMVLLDDEDRILFCNAAAAQHFGLDAGRDLGQHIAHLVRDPVFLAWQEQSGAAPLDMRGHFDTPGHPVQLVVQRQPYENARKGKGRALLLSTDVTVQRQTEAMRRDFVANVSHEIRTPLTVLAGFIETLQSLDLSADDQARYIDLMSQQAARMQALVADLLTLSRLEGNPPPGLRERADLHELTVQSAAQAQALSARLYGAGAQHIEVGADTDFDLSGAASELRSAMDNLLANAVRYSGAQGRISAHWSREDNGGARFEVADNGPGIAPEHLPRLTERFYRVDRSRARAANGEGGTGLGLSIIRHVVERHGGALRIASELGHGSRFALEFPKARVQEKALTGVEHDEAV